MKVNYLRKFKIVRNTQNKFRDLLLVPLLLMLIIISSCDKHEIRKELYAFSENPKEEYQVLETDNGSFVKDGNYKSWFENGQIRERGQYELNKQIGEWIGYYKNGNRSEVGRYMDGKKEGKWQTWFSSGELGSEENFAMDQTEGEQKTWYKNGQLKVVKLYENNIRTGRWEEFDIEGNLRRIYNHHNGLDTALVGKWYVKQTKFTIEFNADNTCAQYRKGGKNYRKGKYELNGKYLKYLNARYEIRELTEDHYVMVSQGSLFGPQQFDARRLN